MTSLLQVPQGAIFQLYPIVEPEGHDMDEPHKCRCFPGVDAYMDDEGLVDMVIVQHRYIQ